MFPLSESESSRQNTPVGQLQGGTGEIFQNNMNHFICFASQQFFTVHTVDDGRYCIVQMVCESNIVYVQITQAIGILVYIKYIVTGPPPKGWQTWILQPPSIRPHGGDGGLYSHPPGGCTIHRTGLRRGLVWPPKGGRGGAILAHFVACMVFVCLPSGGWLDNISDILCTGSLVEIYSKWIKLWYAIVTSGQNNKFFQDDIKTWSAIVVYHLLSYRLLDIDCFYVKYVKISLS